MIYFLVNGDRNIGSGHFGRCLNIARDLSNHKVTFISWSLDVQFQEVLTSHGISFMKIDCQALGSLAAQLSKIDSGLLITDTDNYQVYEPAFQQSVKGKGLKLMIITVTDEYRYYADIVMNQSILSFEQRFITEEYTKLLLGPKYFIFDERYRFLEPAPIRSVGKTVFIGFGAADPMYYTKQILRSLELIRDFDRWKFNVVLGPLNSGERVEEIRQMAENSQCTIEVFYDVKELRELYDQCDLAICSPGRMFWELALFGVRSLIYSSSEREKPSADYLHRHQYAKLVQHCDESWQDQRLIKELLNQNAIAPKLRELQEQINPNGLKYICEEIEEIVKK